MFSAYSVNVGSNVLAGLTTLDAQINPEVDNEVGIGSLFPPFAVMRAVKPTMAFQARNLAAAMAVTGTTGAAIGADPLVGHFVALDNGDPTAATVTYSMQDGIILPRRLSCSHRGDAVVDVEALSRSEDGSVSPMVIGTGSAATVPRDNARWTIKSVSINGITFDCLTDVSIDFGVNAQTLGCNSDVFDKFVVKDQGVTPSIAITTYDLARLSDVGIAAKRGTHANTSITFRQYDPSGLSFVDSSSDITFTASGLATIGNASGSGPQPANGVINVACDWDGANAPIVLSSAA